MNIIKRSAKKVGDDAINIIRETEHFAEDIGTGVISVVKPIIKLFHKEKIVNRVRKHRNCPKNKCEFHKKRK